MDSGRYLQCLAADEARLRAVAERDLTAAVPSCPGWRVSDLVDHVALVYLHKVECMRGGAPAQWPPPAPPAPPLERLDHAYAALSEEFARRPADSPSYTWYEPDQRVGFWHRRMAQETVIHRIDAELALDEPLAPVPDDLALDGIDEVLERFLGYGSVAWREDFEHGQLDRLRDAAVVVSAGDRGWLVRTAPGSVAVEPTAGDAVPAGDAGAVGRVGADPLTMLRWLWRRGGDERVIRVGDEGALTQLRELLYVVTQ